MLKFLKIVTIVNYEFHFNIFSVDYYEIILKNYFCSIIYLTKIFNLNY